MLYFVLYEREWCDSLGAHLIDPSDPAWPELSGVSDGPFCRSILLVEQALLLWAVCVVRLATLLCSLSTQDTRAEWARR